jgi:hypothetical protein
MPRTMKMSNEPVTSAGRELDLATPVLVALARYLRTPSSVRSAASRVMLDSLPMNVAARRNDISPSRSRWWPENPPAHPLEDKAPQCP